MLNILEILKNVPKGINLYHTSYGKVRFDGIDEVMPKIIVFKPALGEIYLDEFGRPLLLNCECKKIFIPDLEVVLYPSKEHMDWNDYYYLRYKDNGTCFTIDNNSYIKLSDKTAMCTTSNDVVDITKLDFSKAFIVSEPSIIFTYLIRNNKDLIIDKIIDTYISDKSKFKFELHEDNIELYGDLYVKIR